MRRYSAALTPECQCPEMRASRRIPKKSATRAAANSAGGITRRRGSAASSAPGAGQRLTQVRQPTHSGEAMLAFLSTGSSAGQLRAHLPQLTQRSASRRTRSGPAEASRPARAP